MNLEALRARSVTVQHTRKVIEAANRSLGEPLDRRTAPLLRSREATVLVAPVLDGVVVTVKPTAGPAWILDGVTAVLRPSVGSTNPLRFGVLDECGQLRVRELVDVPHRLELRPPWWLDEQQCAAVRDGCLAPAALAVPVSLPPLLRTHAGWAAAETLSWAEVRSVPLLSADGSLEYTVTRVGGFTVSAGLRAEDADGLAAVCTAAEPAFGSARPRLSAPYSWFDQCDADGVWRALRMSCDRLLMLGAVAQPPPPDLDRDADAPLEGPLAEALASTEVARRRAAALELTADLLEGSARGRGSAGSS